MVQIFWATLYIKHGTCVSVKAENDWLGVGRPQVAVHRSCTCSSFRKLNPKPQTVADQKMAVHAVWNDLPDETICKCVPSFRK